MWHILKLRLCLALALLPLLAHSNEISYTTDDGERMTLHVDPDERFGDVLMQLAALVNDERQSVAGEFLLDESDSEGAEVAYAFQFMIGNDSFGIIEAARNMPPGVRNYYAPLTDNEKADIRYIVVTLGNVPLVGLLGYKPSLERAGDRIDKIHPLRFLEWVFTNEELKVGIRNIKNRGGWVWADFYDGLSNSLNEEFNYQNMKDDFIYDFAANVKIDPNAIINLIRQRQWSAFIDALISGLPRQGDTKRYNM